MRLIMHHARLAAVIAALLSCASAFADNVYINSDSNVSDYTNPTLSGNVLLFDTNGVTLTVDESVSVSKASVWGSCSINISIDSGNTFAATSTAGTGFNTGNASSYTYINGSGTLDGSVRAYGGTGTLNISSNMNASYIYQDTASKIIYSDTGGNSWNNGLITSSSYNNKFYLVGGGSSVSSSTEITGSATLGDIYLSNNAHLILNSASFTANGTLKLVEVTQSTIELTRGSRTSPYTFGSKIRLNGGSTMILNGENAYTGLTNTVFSAGTVNTVYINDQTDLAGFVIYNLGNLTLTRTLNVVLAAKDADDPYILKLAHFTSVAANSAILNTDSLTTTYGGGTVDNIYINFVNFELKTVMVTNDLLTSADWSHITADGWENFYIDDDGYLAATAVPEPAEWAAIFGALALGAALYRKRGGR